MKRSIIDTQVRIWNESEEGKVFRKYKKTWYRDKIIETLKNDQVYIVKKLRVGNSPLRDHRKGDGSKKCSCGEEDETNEHFFLKCKKYSKIRKEMITSVNNVKKTFPELTQVQIILGMYPSVYKSKIKVEQYRNLITKNFTKVFQYIKKSKRFERDHKE